MSGNMATNISEEEFLRLQNQLIELRTANYSLEEQYAVQVSKNKQLSLRVEALEKECNKAHSSINISKRVRNSDLIQQNEALQLKLQAQEDEFRLQNQTLLEELSSLVLENEKLGSKINLTASEAESASEVNEEVKKLRSEASAFQRALSEERLRSAQEISSLRATLSILTENMEEDVQQELCGGYVYEVDSQSPELDLFGVTTFNLGKEEECICCEGLGEEMRGVGVKVQAEKKENATETEFLNAYQVSQAELGDVKEELDKVRESYHLETRKLTEKLHEEAEKNRGLEKKLLDIQKKHNEYQHESEKKIAELENNLQLIVAEQEKQVHVINKFNFQKREHDAQILQMKKEMSKNNLESEIMHSQLIDSLENIEKLNSSVVSLQAVNQQLTKCVEENKAASEARRHMIDEMAANNKQLLNEYENKIHQLENEKNLVEYKYEEQIETLVRLKNDLEFVEKQLYGKDSQMKELEQQLVDLAAERSLNEKKGAVICRDLKRQLASERRRVEKLQERLADSSSHTKQVADSTKVPDAETTSISSWSLMSGNMEPQESSTRESSLVAGSPTNINGNIFPQPDEMDLDQENRNLLERVTSLQEEKWVLEERINHLEQGSAAMADDLMKKSEVIQFYCMEGRPDPQTSSSGKKAVKKLSEFLKMSEEEHLHESNARMQRMLEEMLTKNMYLQRDIEQMSKELEKLHQISKPKEDC